MQLLVAAICDSATDYQGKLCLLGAFDTIQFHKLPGHHPQCFIALRFVFERSESGLHTIETAFLSPDNEPVMQAITAKSTVVFPPETRFLSNNIIIMLQNVRFEKTGPHSVVISVDGERRTTIPLTVRLIQRQAPRTN